MAPKKNRSETYGFLPTAISPGIRLFPIAQALGNYKPSDFSGDFRAALNVALLAFPQGMAYALVAGIPIKYGIFGSAVAAIAGSFFAGSRFIALGPTNATAVLLFGTFAGLQLTNADGVASGEALALLPLFPLLAGIFLVAASWLRLATMVQYVSRTVITAYVTAAAVLIIANQCHHILGFRFEDGEAPSTFLEVAWATIRSLGNASGPAIAMSALTAVLFLLLRGRFRKLPNVAITLVLASLASLGFKAYGFELQTLEAFSAGAGFFAPPDFAAMDTSSLGTICWTAGALALLCALEGISIGKSLAARAGERLNANQETFAIGAGNLACAFFSGMPASGSLTRSTVNTQSGARSQVAMLFTGLIVLAGAFFLGQLVSYVPLPALATLVVFIGASLIRSKQIRAVARATRSDGIAFTVTLVFGLLLSLQIAIFAGVTTSILLFLRKVSEPELVEYGYTQDGHLAAISDNAERPEPEVSIVHVEGELFFAAAELFYEQIRRVGEDRNLCVLVLKLRNAHHLDATSVLALVELLDYLKEKNCHVLLCEIRKDVLRIFRDSGLLPRLNRKNLFIDSPSNPTLSIAKAIRRAKELVKGEKAQVTIYAEQMKQSERSAKES